MAHRIREAMKDMGIDPIGGEGKTVEADETHVGGSARNRAYVKKAPKKKIVMALVERGGGCSLCTHCTSNSKNFATDNRQDRLAQVSFHDRRRAMVRSRWR